MFDSFSTWTQQVQLLALLAAENGQPLWELHEETPPADSSESGRSSVRASARQRRSSTFRTPSPSS